MTHDRLQHRFVRHFPDKLEPGLLYVSMDLGSATHRCCCGCGEEVVTPITPTDWKLTYDGETISLWPSVGNWNLPCRSHYIIERSEIRWYRAWTPQQIESERMRDKAAKAAQFANDAAIQPTSPKSQVESTKMPKTGFFKSWWNWASGR